MIWSWVNVRMNEQLKQGLHVAGVTLQIVPTPMQNDGFRAAPRKTMLKNEVESLRDELRQKDAQEQQTLWEQ